MRDVPSPPPGTVAEQASFEAQSPNEPLGSGATAIAAFAGILTPFGSRVAGGSLVCVRPVAARKTSYLAPSSSLKGA